MYRLIIAVCLFALTSPAFAAEPTAAPAPEPAAAPAPETTAALAPEPQKEVMLKPTESDIEAQLKNATVASLEELKKQNFDFNAQDSNGNTPLFYLLTRNRNLETAVKAIELGADVNTPTKSGILPINIPTSKANELQLQIIMMQAMGLDLNDPEVQEKVQEKLFHEMERMFKMAQMLIEKGADINQEGALGTPLMNAATNAWNYEIAKMLIEKGANVNAQDKNGKTALFYAAAGNNDDISVLLLKSGADADIKDNSGKTYLEIERLDVEKPL